MDWFLNGAFLLSQSTQSTLYNFFLVLSIYLYQALVLPVVSWQGGTLQAEFVKLK